MSMCLDRQSPSVLCCDTAGSARLHRLVRVIVQGWRRSSVETASRDAAIEANLRELGYG